MKITILAIAVTIVAMIVGIVLKCNNKSYENLYLTDTVWRDKYNREHRKVDVLETENAKAILSIQSKDSTINRLKSTIKQYMSKLTPSSSVSVVSAITKVDTAVMTIYDTIRKVLYTNVDLKKWGNVSVETINDSSRVRLNIKNDYAIVLGYEKVSLFKRKPFAEVINENPYTSTVAVRTYKVKTPKPKRFNLSLQAGYGINVRLMPLPYVGIGISYNLIPLF